MINSEEILFVVDENNQPAIPQSRKAVHKQGLWHRSTNIWITNSKKQILCQKRSMQKDSNPGLWEPCFGGHVLAGEEYRNNALIELREEIGLILDAPQLIQIVIYKSDAYKEFQSNFWILWDGKIEDISFEQAEITELKWLTLNMVDQQLADDREKVWSHIENEKEIFAWIQGKYN